jgi:hypothetical protein
MHAPDWSMQILKLADYSAFFIWLAAVPAASTLLSAFFPTAIAALRICKAM